MCVCVGNGGEGKGGGGKKESPCVLSLPIELPGRQQKQCINVQILRMVVPCVVLDPEAAVLAG